MGGRAGKPETLVTSLPVSAGAGWANVITKSKKFHLKIIRLGLGSTLSTEALCLGVCLSNTL
jgi:hypothetical protein